MNQPQVLIVGLGGLGSWVLEFLARTEGISHIVGADLNEEWGRRKVYSVTSGAILQGFYPRLEFVQIDLRDVDATAETLARLQPQLIINCATLQTWWLRKTLPPEIADRLSEAGSGPWLSTHLALSRKLMLAVQADGAELLTVEGLDEDGNVIATTTTDANGYYSFEGVPPGTYTVTLTVGTGMSQRTRSKAVCVHEEQA